MNKKINTLTKKHKWIRLCSKKNVVFNDPDFPVPCFIHVNVGTSAPDRLDEANFSGSS